jgi:hypothetical protein
VFEIKDAVVFELSPIEQQVGYSDTLRPGHVRIALAGCAHAFLQRLDPSEEA